MFGGTQQQQNAYTFQFVRSLLKPSPEKWVKVLGIPVPEDGGCSVWLEQIKKTWHQQLHIIKRISNRLGGATTETLKLLTQAVLTSKVTYGAVCFDFTKAQLQQLEVLHRESLRVITGLPKHAKLEELYKHAQLPPLTEIIRTRQEGHDFRRASTLAGRALLALLPQCAAPQHPIPLPLPPWDDFIVVNPKPLPVTGPTLRHSNKHRRTSEMTERFPHSAVYTDATWDPTTNTAGLAAIHSTFQAACQQEYPTAPSSTHLQLEAILLAVRQLQISHWPTNQPHATIFTASQEAFRALRRVPYQNSICASIKMLARRLHCTTGLQIRVDWVPGHCVNSTKEAARALASDVLSTRSHPVLPHHDPNLDPFEARATYQRCARARLRSHIPANDYPLPTGLPRGLQVLIHKARARAALTEDILFKWRSYIPKKGRPPVLPGATASNSPPPAMTPPTCVTCSLGATPTIEHLLWTCPGLHAERTSCKHSSITCLTDWLYPPAATAKQVFASLWDFALATGVHLRM